MERWTILRKGADFERIGKKFRISPRLACLIRNRDIVGDEEVRQYLYGTLADLYDGGLMKDMDRAVRILKEKIQGKKRIRVIGDYDSDGVNSAYILLSALKRLGADADTDIPDRMKDGYGLNARLIEKAHEDGIDTILTCDNGIAAKEEIRYGKSLGMTVIVTDHHEVPFAEGDEGKCFILPPADAVVDPKREDCPYPFKGLCGAAVAYKLAEKVYESFGRETGEIEDLIENVAIATVTDVMELVGENRIFVREGLKRIRFTENPGLRALLACTGTEEKEIGYYHAGFVIGPCLNAGGRLATAKQALRLFETEDEEEARRLAEELKELNEERKDMTEKAVDEGTDIIESTDVGKDKVLLLYLQDCHESIAGIVAGRIRERFHKPAFVLTDAVQEAKGSGRSIEAYHMYEELNRCGEYLTKFGGHKLAAGFSLKKEYIGLLRQKLNENCVLTEEEMAEKVVIDMEMPFSCVTEELIRELELLEPCGNGNKKPVFARRNAVILSGRVLGKNGNVLRLRLDDATASVEAVYFGDIGEFSACLEEKYGKGAWEEMLRGRKRDMELTVTYYPKVNEYQGQRSVQIVITHYK